MVSAASLHRGCAGLLIAGLSIFTSSIEAQEPAPEVLLTAVREGEYIVVSANVELPADPAIAWSVLTDYEGYPRFISTMSESRIVARSSDGIVLQQRGEFGMLFFSQAIEVRLLVVEQPPRSVVSRSIEGSFRDLSGRYELQTVAGGVRLAYRGRFIPDFTVPPLIGLPSVRYALRRHFQELSDEIVRRSRARPAEDKP